MTPGDNPYFDQRGDRDVESRWAFPFGGGILIRSHLRQIQRRSSLRGILCGGTRWRMMRVRGDGMHFSITCKR